MNAPLKLLEDKSNISTDEFTRTVVEPSKPLRKLLKTTTEEGFIITPELMWGK